ncbi:MAG: hypothetical protein P8Z34_14800 [Anaerolineales bacterium]
MQSFFAGRLLPAVIKLLVWTQRVLFGERHGIVRTDTVGDRAAGEDQFLDLCLHGRVENVVGSTYVDLLKILRIGQTPKLERHVNQDVCTFDRLDDSRIAYIRLDEFELLRLWRIDGGLNIDADNAFDFSVFLQRRY